MSLLLDLRITRLSYSLVCGKNCPQKCACGWVFLFLFLLVALCSSQTTRKPIMGTSLSTEVSPQVAAAVKQTISSHPIVIYSKSYCPYCIRVKNLFQSINQNFHCIELDERSDGSEIQSALYQMTNQSTVPSVFIHGQHIGGCDDTTALHRQNKLMPMILKQSQ